VIIFSISERLSVLELETAQLSRSRYWRSVAEDKIFIRRLQSVLNSSVRLVTGARKNDHVTSVPRDRHWLPITERIEYKLCTLVYRCLHGNASQYPLLITWHWRPPSRSKERLAIGGHSLWKCRELVYRLATEPSQLQARAPGSLPINVRSAQSMYSFR